MKLSVDYEVKLTTGKGVYDGTTHSINVKFIGTASETDEMTCDTPFIVAPSVTGSCSLTSSVNIGHYRCVQLRTRGYGDDASIVKVTF